MKLNLSWTDRRIDFLHLRDDSFLNSVNPEIRSKLWIPEIGTYDSNYKIPSLKSKYFIVYFTGFANAKTGDLQRDEYKIVLVSKESVPEPYSTYRALEDTVYKGYKNPLHFMRR